VIISSGQISKPISQLTPATPQQPNHISPNQPGYLYRCGCGISLPSAAPAPKQSVISNLGSVPSPLSSPYPVSNPHFWSHSTPGEKRRREPRITTALHASQPIRP